MSQSLAINLPVTALRDLANKHGLILVPAPSQSPKTEFTVKEFAAEVGVSDTTVRRWIKDSKISFRQINKWLIRIPAEEVGRIKK